MGKYKGFVIVFYQILLGLWQFDVIWQMNGGGCMFNLYIFVDGIFLWDVCYKGFS